MLQPSRTIWVDCDDTLVRYLDASGAVAAGKHPYGEGSDQWEWNSELVTELRRAACGGFALALWSGGGTAWAMLWRDRLGCDLGDGERVAGMIRHRVFSKNPKLPQPGDLCIDDGLEFAVPEGVMVATPVEFIEDSRILPIIVCPRCGEEQRDLDGFGFIACIACGLCTHPEGYGSKCTLCGAEDDSDDR